MRQVSNRQEYEKIFNQIGVGTVFSPELEEMRNVCFLIATYGYKEMDKDGLRLYAYENQINLEYPTDAIRSWIARFGWLDKVVQWQTQFTHLNGEPFQDLHDWMCQSSFSDRKLLSAINEVIADKQLYVAINSSKWLRSIL